MTHPKPNIQGPKEMRSPKPDVLGTWAQSDLMWQNSNADESQARETQSPNSENTTQASRSLHAFSRLCVCALMLRLFCLCVDADHFVINWHTIDGGGGTSTGDVYSVSGTIGQPDAGLPMTGGVYSVTGGFWALPTAVQTEGAPTLTISPATPGNARVSWSPNAPGWVLQENLDIGTSNWVDSPSGSTNPIVVPATLSKRFYRLFKPSPP